MNKFGVLFEKLVRHILSLTFNFFHKELSAEKSNLIIQFVKFCFVGLTNFAVSYIVYGLFLFMGLPWLFGSTMGFIISVLNSFYWNDKYVFTNTGHEKRGKIQVLTKTFISYGFSGFLLSNILLFIWNDLLYIPPILGPIINLLITTPVNFILNKLWAFKTKKK